VPTKVAIITGSLANSLLISAIIPGSTMVIDYLSMKIFTGPGVRLLMDSSREAEVGQLI
jgi:hypothetical protein